MAGDMYGDIERGRNNVVHELGHLFGNTWKNGQPYEDMAKALGTNRLLRRDNPQRGTYYGFASGYEHLRWQMSTTNANTANEIFADMFLGWTFNTWYSGDNINEVNAATERMTWMDQNIPLWVP
jgi:hypothetical protein